MDKAKQDKYRAEMIEFYEKRAFEQLALYGFYGQKYQAVEKQIADLEAREAEAKKMADDLSTQPNRTADIKNKIKGLLDDVYKYKEMVKSTSKIREKFFNQAAGHQTEAMTALDQIEHIKNFSVKTPEQIEADKNKLAETKP